MRATIYQRPCAGNIGLLLEAESETDNATLDKLEEFVQESRGWLYRSSFGGVIAGRRTMCLRPENPLCAHDYGSAAGRFCCLCGKARPEKEGPTAPRA